MLIFIPDFGDLTSFQTHKGSETEVLLIWSHRYKQLCMVALADG